MEWDEIRNLAREKASSLSGKYVERLEFEIKEIEKQGAGDYWIDVIEGKETYNENPHGLVLPFILGKTPVDPIKAGIDHEIVYQPDFPDIDVDFLPEARDQVKDYITKQYGEAHVCNVGLWQTFKPRSALNDACRCHEEEVVRTEVASKILAITKTLPDEFDDMDLAKAKEEYSEFGAFATEYPEIVAVAYSMVGCIRAQGKHAGGIIISSEPIREHIPLTFIGSSGNKQWTAEWTEGMRSTQLSKFGFVKFDILGLINIQYIHEAGEMIKKNHSVAINWEDMDPEEDRAGWMTHTNGSKTPILFGDKDTISLANEVLTDSIFQFNTRFQKAILKQGGVKSFDDLVVYNALGRPGPMPMIETYVKRRDGEADWKDKDHPILQRILGKTHGVICFDEDTMMRTAFGRDKRIKSLTMGEDMVSFNRKTNQFEVKPVERVGKTRTEAGLKITTDDHRELVITRDHKFICYGDVEKRADELEVNDLVPVPKTIPWAFNGRELDKNGLTCTNEDLAYLVGFLIGDGCLTSSQVAVCCGNKEPIADQLMEFIQAFGVQARKYWHCRSWYLGISDKGHKKNRLKELLKNLGLLCNVYNKRIPGDIYNSEKSISACLAGLIDADGSVSINNHNTPLISITSCNKLLLLDISKILDILSLSHNFQRNKIFLWDSGRFNDKIVRYLKIKAQIVPVITGKQLGWIPKSELVKFASGSGKTKRQLERDGLISRSTLRYHHGFVRSSTAAKVGIGYRDIRYQKIKKIEKTGIRNFYGLSVAENHTVVANGIVTKQCFQEQLQQIWTSMAKLTVPEAEKARNQVKKKKKEDLMKLGPKVIKGLQEHIGKEKAEQMWEVMTAFGRYAFNYSHSLAYAIISYRCLWLKTHYRSEWWAAVLSHTKESNRLTHLISVAKREGVVFSRVDCNNLSKNFTAVLGEKRKAVVIPGVIGIKGIGENAAKKLIHDEVTYTDLNDFLERCDAPNKSIMERLIKLGAFDDIYSNRKALWYWYAYKKKDKKVVSIIKERFGISDEDINAVRAEQESAYFAQYPKRKKLPNKIKNWKPKIDPSYEEIVRKFPTGYDIEEILVIEKEFFGFYWTSPMSMFDTHGFTIEKAKRKKNSKIECLLVSVQQATSRQGNPYTKLRVTDGLQTTIINIWNASVMDDEAFKKDTGLIVEVKWNAKYQSFVLVGEITALPKKAEFAHATTK